MKGGLTKERLRQIRDWLESRADTRQRGAKYAKPHSLRTQEAIARFGKSARHPLCLAALDLWRMDAGLLELAKGVVSREELLDRVKHQKEQAQALIKQFRKERKEKEANQASALLREIDKHLLKAQEGYQAAVKLRSIYQGWRQPAVARFERERDAVARTGDRTGDTKALKALERVRKRWNDKKAFLGDGDRRTLEILKMLRGKAEAAALAKGGVAAFYWEAASSGDRTLSDEVFQGRLTARQIQSRLVDAPGDRDAKEVRRLIRKLGIRLAKDQRGRKQKPYLAKQKPKRPPGRPRTKPRLMSTGDIDEALAELFGKSRGKVRQSTRNQFWDSTEARRTAAQKRSLTVKGKARKQQ